jgi:hypothetical protein
VSTDCQDDDCKNVTKYSKSSTLVPSSKPFKLNYLLGSVSGLVGFDTVTLGRYQVTSQVFGICSLSRLSSKPYDIFTAMASKTLGLHLRDSGHSGIMGLAFPVEASIPSASGQTLLENMFSQFDDSQKFFALKLNSDKLTSSFTFGQLDPEIPGNISAFAYTQVYPRANTSSGPLYDYWKIPLLSLTVDDVVLPLSSSKLNGAPTQVAVLDTGTTLVLGPTHDVDKFWHAVGGTRRNSDGMWQVKCSRGIVVSFVLGDGDSQRSYPLDPRDVSWDGDKNGEWCLGGIQGNDDVRLSLSMGILNCLTTFYR